MSRKQGTVLIVLITIILGIVLFRFVAGYIVKKDFEQARDALKEMERTYQQVSEQHREARQLRKKAHSLYLRAEAASVDGFPLSEVRKNREAYLKAMELDNEVTRLFIEVTEERGRAKVRYNEAWNRLSPAQQKELRCAVPFEGNGNPAR